MAPMIRRRRQLTGAASVVPMMLIALLVVAYLAVSSSRTNDLQTAPVLANRRMGGINAAARRVGVHAAAYKTPGKGTWMDHIGKGAATLGLVGAMTFGTPLPSMAGEFDVLDAAKPTNGYILDDSPVLQKGSEKKMNEELTLMEINNGYKLNIVTVRKLEDSPDADTLASKMLDKWGGSNKDRSGVLVLVGKNNEVGLVGGEKFMNALGEDKAASVTQETISYFSSEGKPNFGVTEGVKRITAILNGDADPGPPSIKEYRRERTYKTKEEVDKSKGASVEVVGALLLIAFVVPMLQYAGYVQKD
ncbi:hypothetical protein AAMO2058_000467000 [Amorphochlora amoebiformis]|uniref:TPM domain-containing protein n=1 Tax=Amorphochlora amoebiformis TaxID=1561963 RepID=A0A6T6WBQ0_9EUKA|mmetsp:Transcript_28539/g.45455  ORF Transcript_28539/g.45455 Transcript_28539/m.45455 type:complete len:304 (+) Transcript_28539:42-953(+)